jgi:hypothetical protein
MDRQQDQAFRSWLKEQNPAYYLLTNEQYERYLNRWIDEYISSANSQGGR